ncbi:hypothetical protein SAMN05443575_1537 [Jatrophihabitans endophyticus]|uniref:DUF371 domain-containing protein n=1 Tax=Jatrophihabitans endophyticus TaxID=1206085 RepID=A0A1M5HJ18_9ACTN|nr:DUF371 domain-containing protein [Jatrophihabitans endophyticus]SHG15935.1 hypothetical protein SAMN05443575_1537 [Jatrophihabitans endophyticus]
MRFTGRGHPAVRATHGKTLELSPGAELTERGTCIVAVAAEAEPVAPLAGAVRIRLTAGGHRFDLDAVANPAWDPAGPIVIRRGPLRLPGTFATDATAAAADLPAELVARLRDPDTLVTVDVAERPAAQPLLVLCAADPLATHPGPALAAELARADQLIVEDAGARRLVGPARGAAGGRTVVVATADLPGTSLRERPAGVEVDTVGLPPRHAVAAACPSSALLTLAGDGPAAVAALRTTPASHRLVVSVGRAELPELLHRARDVRGSGEATVAQDFGRPRPAAPDSIPDLAGAERVHCCLHPVPAADALDPTVRAAVEALLADGVGTRTAARALTALTGWERRRAYAAVVDWPVT